MKKTSFLLLLLLPVAQIYGQVEVTVHNNKSQNKGLFISETPSIVEDTFRVLSIQSLNKKEHSCEDSKWNETYIIHIENEDGIFVLLSPSTTGITYKNEIKVSDSCFLKIKPYNNHDYYPKHGIFDSFFIHEVCYKLDYGKLWFQNIYTTDNLDGLHIVTEFVLSEGSWKYGVDDFIGIEVEYGPESIRLLKEGLVCHKCSVSKHDRRKLGKTGIRFFNLWDLDFSKLEKIETYLTTCDFFTKDTIVDCPGLVVSDFPELTITVIKREKVYRIHFVDGYSEEIKTCIKLLNDLVPLNKKEFRLCVFMTECHSD